eukprot:5199852-Prymnesium_polylepis.1
MLPANRAAGMGGAPFEELVDLVVFEFWGQGPSTCEETLNLSHPHKFYDESVQVTLRTATVTPCTPS